LITGVLNIDSGVTMKRYLLILTLAGLIIGSLFVLRDSNRLWAQGSTRFALQVSAYSTIAAAQKEIERLKSFKIASRYMTKEDRNQKEWFIVYMDHYETQEEAARQGNRLIKEGIIQNFFIFPIAVKEEPLLKPQESPASKPKELPSPPSKIASKKEPKQTLGKNPVYFGPVIIKEEESTILMTISLSQRIFPKIITQKNENNSHLLVAFKDIDKSVVPIDFRKDNARALLSVSLMQKGTDCTFDLALNPAFNYEVSLDYFEKEKIYSLRIRWESTKEPDPVNAK
jgi:hypothetical protein